ncbi:MAG TPA: alpha/beta hydrolase [Sphingomonas sp.]|nr:alpha/beta hydrolase [Sphingomonas sp.]
MTMHGSSVDRTDPAYQPPVPLGFDMRLIVIIASLLCLASAASPGASTGEHRLRTPDGVELWYRVAGPQRGPVVIFLHGGPGEGSQALQALGGPALEKQVRMVYLDQRGSGRSDRPKDANHYSLTRLEADVDLIRQALGADKIVLLAHSAGTPIALDYAADHPDHVAGLILAGAVPDIPAAIEQLCDRVEAVHPELYAKAVRAGAPGQKCNPFAAFDDAQRQRFFDDNMFPDPAVRDRVNWLDHIPSLANSGELGGALLAQGLMGYRFSRPQRITMPLLFIAGGRDFQTAIPPQRALAAKVRDGRVIVYRNAGHFMFADEPDRFARDVSAFVNRLRP